MSASNIPEGSPLTRNIDDLRHRDWISLNRSNAMGVARASLEIDRQFFETVDRIVGIESDIEKDLRMVHGINLRVSSSKQTSWTYDELIARLNPIVQYQDSIISWEKLGYVDNGNRSSRHVRKLKENVEKLCKEVLEITEILERNKIEAPKITIYQVDEPESRNPIMELAL